MLFSERYAELIKEENGEFVDNIYGPISDDVKADISRTMREYAEPAVIYPNRYDSYEIRTTALEIAINSFNEIKGTSYITLKHNVFDGPMYDHLAAAFTPFLFDVIELQYAELSAGEKSEFQSEINATFYHHDVPWLLHEGRMVKIDTVQFELDLRQKALEQLCKMKDCDPKFQAAYSELLEACDDFTAGKYSGAILNAERSYESVLKVICGIEKGTAESLTKAYMDTQAGTLPAIMKVTGFQSNVMMALPYIRNHVSSGHGEGATPVVIKKPLAKLAINLSAAMNTYLIEEYRDRLTVAQNEGSENIDSELPF